MQELRPDAVDDPVGHDRLDLLSPAGNLLHHAVRLVPPASRIDQQQPARAVRAVMAGDDPATIVGCPGTGWA
jgi:hypothetical protein